MLDVGECLVDDLEVRPGGIAGSNIVSNGDLRIGLHRLEPARRSPAFEPRRRPAAWAVTRAANPCICAPATAMWTLGDYVQGSLTQTSLASGQTATLRLKARWLHGWPEVLMRVNGNYLEVTGAAPLPANLGTPGLPNSRYTAKPGPAIYEVKHTPSLPAANAAGGGHGPLSRPQLRSNQRCFIESIPRRTRLRPIPRCR